MKIALLIAGATCPIMSAQKKPLQFQEAIAAYRKALMETVVYKAADYMTVWYYKHYKNASVWEVIPVDTTPRMCFRS